MIHHAVCTCINGIKYEMLKSVNIFDIICQEEVHESALKNTHNIDTKVIVIVHEVALTGNVEGSLSKNGRHAL